MTGRDDDLDDPFIARYADRIADEVEVLWRADFDRAVDLENRGYDEDAQLLLRADEIRARWAADPTVRPNWLEITEIHDAWIHAPEAMKQAHEVFMPGGLRPPDMNDTRWSSHMQAREMTGHGAWPGFEPTYSTDVSERHEPMTDTTDRDRIDEFTTESDAEQAAADRSGQERAGEGQQWPTPVLSRNPEDGYETPWEFDSDYSRRFGSNSVRYDSAHPAPSFGASVAARTSALADYKPGNALAAAIERQSERAGVER